MNYEVKDFKLPNKYNWVDTSAPQFNYALDKLLNSNDNLLIMGPGGTGKSLLLEIYYSMVNDKLNVGIVAPTGVAAANLALKGVPAQTMHAFFEMSNTDLHELKVDIMNEEKLDIVRELDVLIFDEISMVNPEIFDLIKYHFDELKGIGNYPRMIMFGDVLQLPPVVNLEDDIVRDYYISTYGGNIFFFNSHFWTVLKDTTTCIKLDKIYRQSDNSFSNILNRIRLGKVTNEDLGLLNSRVINPSKFVGEHPYMLYLASTNKRVDELNAIYDKMFANAKRKTYYSVGTGTMKFAPRDSVTISVGQQIMCTANNRAEGYQNGTLAKVLDVRDEIVVAQKSNGDIINVVPYTRNDYRYRYNKETKKVEIERPGTWTMMACKPAFASTIHKSQSLTLESIYVDLVNWVPEAGVYLALSRCKSLEGIGMIRPIFKADIKLNWRALEFYNNIESINLD